MWETMDTALKGHPLDPYKFVALVRRRGFESYLPVTCFWGHGMKNPRWVFDGQKSGEEPMYWCPFPT